MSATDGTATAYSPMLPFVRFAGRTWRGVGRDSVDVARWEFILGGRAVQITHRLEGGDYGGRSIVFFDERAKVYVVHYFTTAGFHTLGALEAKDGAIEVIEEVSGHATISRVRSRSTLENGRLITRADYLKGGAWVAGHSFVYEEAPEAVVGY